MVLWSREGENEFPIVCLNCVSWLWKGVIFLFYFWFVLVSFSCWFNQRRRRRKKAPQALSLSSPAPLSFLCSWLLWFVVASVILSAYRKQCCAQDDISPQIVLRSLLFCLLVQEFVPNNARTILCFFYYYSFLPFFVSFFVSSFLLFFSFSVVLA